MEKRMFRLEVVGVILSTIIGSGLHFAYEWSGSNLLVAIFAAVNESTWEHMKLGFWPLFFWAIWEYVDFGMVVKNFLFAKFLTLSVFCLSIPVLFYSYVAILGKNYLPIDISIFVIGIILGQTVGYKVMKNKKDLGLKKLSISLILLMVFGFGIFSFFTPNNFLFRDPVTGNYGVGK